MEKHQMSFISRIIFFVCLVLVLPQIDNGQKKTHQYNKKTSRADQLLFPVKQNGKWGYINNTGKIVIKPQFYFANPFDDGLAAVGKEYESNNGNKYIDGFIDTSGKFVIRLPHNGKDQIYPLSEGLALVDFYKSVTDGNVSIFKAGFIDKTGKVVIKPQFDENNWGKGSFSEGLAKVQINGKCGYINKKGIFVINPVYYLCSPFREGIAKVSKEKESMSIDKKEKFWLKLIL